MKKYSLLCLAVAAGMTAGRMFDRGPLTVEAGANGGAASPCLDVNQDGSVDVSDAVRLLQWLFLGGPEPPCTGASPAHPSRLPATGQEMYYAAGFGSADCAGDGGCPGQDGFYRTGCPAADRFADNGDGTVTDHCTGLMWLQDAAEVGALDWCDALRYCEDLMFTDHADWRLPNVRELSSIADYGTGSPPAIDSIFGVSSSPASYWSSTSYTAGNGAGPPTAWSVDFTGGLLRTGAKASAALVRPVRGGS
jgi:hypothetical protein